MLLSVAPMCGYKGRPWLIVTPRYFLLYVASKGDPGLLSLTGICYCQWLLRETLANCRFQVLATVCGFQGRPWLIVNPRYLLLSVASKETPLLMLLSVAPMCGYKGRPWLIVTPRYFLLYVASKGDPGLLSLTGTCYCQWLLRETLANCRFQVLATVCGFQGRPWLIVTPRYLLLPVASKGDPG